MFQKAGDKRHMLVLEQSCVQKVEKWRRFYIYKVSGGGGCGCDEYRRWEKMYFILDSIETRYLADAANCPKKKQSTLGKDARKWQ